MENKFNGLVKNMLSSNAQTINELYNTISESEAKLHRSENINILLRKENEELKYDVDTNCGLHVQELEKKIVCYSNSISIGTTRGCSPPD